MDIAEKLISRSRIKKFPPYFFRELDRKKEKAQRRGKKIISLAVGDPDISTPPEIAGFAARQVTRPENHRYPNGRGMLRLRKALAEWHAGRNNIRLDPEKEILALIGSKEGIAHLPFLLLNRGDAAIIPDPSYPAYKTGVFLCEGEIRTVPLLEENGFMPDPDLISGKILSRAKLFFLNYPNNPTGAVATRNFYRKMVGLAKKHSFIIAQDAAYSELYFGSPPPSILEIPGAREVCVEFHSLSKTFCMTGWRLAWLIGNGRVVRALGNLKENIDSGQFNAVQETAIYAVKNYARFSPKIRETFGKRRDFFVGELRKAGWRTETPEAGFFVWARPPRRIASDRCALKMLSAGVLASPGAGFGKRGEGYIRFALTVPLSGLKAAAKKIKRIKW